MKSKIQETSSGEMIHVLPIGTRVRHKKHPELTGYIKQHEYHESGKISPIPYNVNWDNNALASRLLGWFFIYSTNEALELEEQDERRVRV